MPGGTKAGRVTTGVTDCRVRITSRFGRSGPGGLPGAGGDGDGKGGTNGVDDGMTRPRVTDSLTTLLAVAALAFRLIKGAHSDVSKEKVTTIEIETDRFPERAVGRER